MEKLALLTIAVTLLFTFFISFWEKTTRCAPTITPGSVSSPHWSSSSEDISGQCRILFFSEIECEDEIYSACQLQSAVKLDKSSPPTPIVVVDSNNNNKSNNINKNNSVTCSPIKESPQVLHHQQQPAQKKQQPPVPETRPLSVTAKLIGNIVDTPIQSPRLQTATSKLFAPRTEEMSKGFLTFSEEEPGLTSKWFLD